MFLTIGPAATPEFVIAKWHVGAAMSEAQATTGALPRRTLLTQVQQGPTPQAAMPTVVPSAVVSQPTSGKPSGGPTNGQPTNAQGLAVASNAATGGVQNVISGVPAYLWYNGCAPTAGGMVVGYWDMHGFDNLIPGDSTIQTLAVNNAIASAEHISDYVIPQESDYATIPLTDESETGPAHASNSIADFMHTSWSLYGLCYGWTFYDDIGPGIDGYAELAGYSAFTTRDQVYGSSLWNSYVTEIDAGRPAVFLVDSDGDASTDHFITAIGYDTASHTYAAYNTWDGLVHWYRFGSMSYSQTFGIYGATFITPPMDPPTADAGGPYTINEGDSLTLDASNSHAADSSSQIVTYEWDFNNDGTYDFVSTTPTATVPWSTLYESGIVNGPNQYVIGLQVTDNRLSTATASTTVSVQDTLPTISLSGNATGNIQASYFLYLNVVDPGADVIDSWQIDWGDGHIDPLVGNLSMAEHTYTSVGNYTIGASATSSAGTFASINELAVNVVDAPMQLMPLAKSVSMMTGRVHGFAADFFDPRNFAMHTATWDWGDGTTSDARIDLGGEFNTATGEHFYANSGTYTVTVTIAREDGSSIVSGTQAAIVMSVGLVPDPVDPTKTALLVSGTAGVDTILLGYSNKGTVQVAINSRIIGSYKPTGHLIVYGSGGNDRIVIGSKITLPAWLFGGDGNDQLTGGAGVNLLVGGAGSDRLTGGSACDMLISGTTAFDNDDQALAAIMAEWESVHPMAQKVANLAGDPSANGLNGLCYLAPNMTVFDDNATDTVLGGAGSDLFFANRTSIPGGSAANRDKVSDLTNSDCLADLGYMLPATVQKKVTTGLRSIRV